MRLSKLERQHLIILAIKISKGFQLHRPSGEGGTPRDFYLSAPPDTPGPRRQTVHQHVFWALARLNLIVQGERTTRDEQGAQHTDPVVLATAPHVWLISDAGRRYLADNLIEFNS